MVRGTRFIGSAGSGVCPSCSQSGLRSPPKELAGDDKGLYRRLDNNEVGDWPVVSEETQAKKFSEWVEDGTASNSSYSRSSS